MEGSALGRLAPWTTNDDLLGTTWDGREPSLEHNPMLAHSEVSPIVLNGAYFLQSVHRIAV